MLDNFVGNFNAGDWIHLVTTATPEQMAGIMAHEAHHLATVRVEVNMDTMDRETYLKALFHNEAEAQTRLFEHHEDLGTAGSKEYAAAADKAEQALRDSWLTKLKQFMGGGEVTPEQIQAARDQAGKAALAKLEGREFGAAEYYAAADAAERQIKAQNP